jgi:hypothetical protein
MYVRRVLVSCAVLDTAPRRLGGIVFQLVAITAYTCLAAEFLLRFVKDKPIRPTAHMPVPTSAGREKGQKLQGKLRKMVIGLCISTVVIFIRSVYRTIELADGWNGKVIRTQVYFSQSSASNCLRAILYAEQIHRRFRRCHDHYRHVHVRRVLRKQSYDT